MRGHGARVPILVGLIGLLSTAASPQATSSGASGKAVEPADRAAPGAAIAGQLRRGEWAPALAAAQAGIDRELAARQDHPQDHPTLAELVAWRAVAEAGLQRADDADWDWQVAQNLAGGWPISWEDLSSFGEAAKHLAQHPLRKVGEAPAGLDVRKASSAGGAAKEAKPARIASAAPPVLPPVLRGRSVPKWLVAELVINAAGRPRDPVVVTSRLPEMTYAVLEAARGWKFTPAMAAGAPVASFYTLNANGPAGKPLEELIRLDDAALRKVAELLRAHQWEEAEKRAHAQWNHAIDDNEQPATYLAVLLTLRALADAGLGREAPAICRWNAAQTLDPLLFHAGLRAYGAPGELLERNRWGAFPLTAEVAAAGLAAKPERIEPPKVVHETPPRYPNYLSQTTTSGTAVVAMIIDRAGVVREAEIQRSSGWHDMDASALDTVCDWQIEAERVDGKPVPVHYQWTVTFQVRTSPVN
ncbi:MAG TPA: energy transducer TonB [Thermoanaerobaculia bacterium]|jgi:TonB family protein